MLDIRKALLFCLAIVAMIAVAAGPAGARTHGRKAGGHTHARRATGGGPARFSLLDYNTFAPGTLAADARRYSVMVLYAHEARFVPLLHRYNPHLIVLMYQFPGYATVSDPAGGMDCTSVSEDVRNGWLLRSRAGLPVTFSGNYITDISNPSFVSSCVSHAISLAKSGGFDGLFFDGAAERFSFEFPSSGLAASVARFSSVPEWQRAVYGLLSYAGRSAHAHGLRMFANIGGGTPSVWRWWNGPLDGAMEESWTDGGLGPAQQLPWWREKLGNVAWSEAHGKYVLLHSYTSSESGNTLALAAMLLAAGGHTSYSTWASSQLGRGPWLSEYAAATRLGRALGGYRIRRGGIYERVFAHGIVLVNPGLRAVSGISLRGRYSGSGLNRVHRVSMSALSGLILLRAG